MMSLFSQPLTAMSAAFIEFLRNVSVCLSTAIISKNFEHVVAHWLIHYHLVLKFSKDFNLAFVLILYLISNMNVFNSI
jgi:triphosphoribosyl-dephospho-CoA synthetase